MPSHTHTHIQASMKIFRGPITTYLMAAYSSEAEGAETLGTTLRTVAAEFKGKVRGGTATGSIPEASLPKACMVMIWLSGCHPNNGPAETTSPTLDQQRLPAPKAPSLVPRRTFSVWARD